MKFAVKIFATIAMLLSIQVHLAQDESVITKIDSLNNLEPGSLSADEYLNVLTTSLELSQEENYKAGEFQALMNLGLNELHKSDFVPAFQYMEQAKAIAQELKDIDKIAYSSYHLGNAFLYTENFEDAALHYQIAAENLEELQDSIWLAFAYNGLGITKKELNQPEESYQQYDKALTILKEIDYKEGMSYPLSNIGDYYLENDQPKIALEYLQKAFAYDSMYNFGKDQAVTLANMGLAYRGMNQLDSSLVFFHRALFDAKQHHDKREMNFIYKDLSETYILMDDHENAYLYLNLYLQSHDSLYGAELKNEILNLKVNKATLQLDHDLLLEKQLNAELNHKNAITQYKLIIVYTAIGVLVLIFLLILTRIRLKNKQKKKELKVKNDLLRYENELQSERMKSQELQNQQLKTDILSKEKDLTNFALDIARKNNYSQKIAEQLKSILKSPKVDMEAKLRELVFFISSQIKVDEDLDEFQQNVDQVNQEFFNRLKADFPKLTKNDLQLCGFIKLQLSTKDIASLKNISVKSVEMNRYRLRKKLDLSADLDITNFLSSY
jgi:tetratricopeptide (TPR) repeat protein